MGYREILTKKFTMVGVNDARISTDEKPIVGTEALATCIGVLLYSEEKKIAIVAHVSSQPMETIDKIFNIIVKNKLYSVNFKYKIIPGYYEEHYEVEDILKKHLSHFTPFEDNEITEKDIRISEEYTSKEFAFDASTGKFVTDKVYFGLDYLSVNGYDIDSQNKKIGRR